MHNCVAPRDIFVHGQANSGQVHSPDYPCKKASDQDQLDMPRKSIKYRSKKYLQYPRGLNTHILFSDPRSNAIRGVGVGSSIGNDNVDNAH